MREKAFESHQPDITLRSGSTLRLRPIQPADDKKLLDLYERLSTRSLYNRFFTIPKPDPEYAAYLANIDGVNHIALVAEIDEKIVAVARFIRKAESPDIAEASFTVADAWQGQGLGSLMLARLAAVACQLGIRAFECQMLAENQPMIKMLARSGFAMEQRLEAGFIQVTLRINS